MRVLSSTYAMPPTYDFPVANRTLELRFPVLHRIYKSTLSFFRKKFAHHVYIKKYLKTIKAWIDVLYYGLNKKGVAVINEDESVNKYLMDYYAEEILWMNRNFDF